MRFLAENKIYFIIYGIITRLLSKFLSSLREQKYFSITLHFNFCDRISENNYHKDLQLLRSLNIEI